MNKIKTLVASVALAAGIPAMAAYHSTPAPVVPCKQHQLLPKVDMNQNEFFAQCDWEKRIKLSGHVNVNYGRASKIIGASYNDSFHNLTFIDGSINDGTDPDHALSDVDSGSDIWLQRAVLNVDAVLNDWAETHVGMLFWNEDNSMANADAMFYNRYHGAFQGNGNVNAVDEANIVLGNFAQTPVYFRLGRQYMDFGWYDKTTTLAPMTQLFSQSSHDAVTVGFMDISGFNGSVSVFRSVDRGSVENTNGSGVGVDRPSDSVNNFVASLSYGMDMGAWNFDAKVDYMHDMVGGVDFMDGYLGNGIIGAVPNRWEPSGRPKGNNIRPDDNTSGWAFTLKAKWSDFDFTGQYVGTSGRLDEDLWTTGGADGANPTDVDIKGAAPSAWMIEGGYSFALMGRDSRISVNYQKTDEAYAGQEAHVGSITGNVWNYYIPEKRFQVSFNHNLMKNVDVWATYAKDKDYGTGHFQSFLNRTTAGAHGNQFLNVAGSGNSNSIFSLGIVGRFN